MGSIALWKFLFLPADHKDSQDYQLTSKHLQLEKRIPFKYVFHANLRVLDKISTAKQRNLRLSFWISFPVCLFSPLTSDGWSFSLSLQHPGLLGALFRAHYLLSSNDTLPTAILYACHLFHYTKQG